MRAQRPRLRRFRVQFRIGRPEAGLTDWQRCLRRRRRRRRSALTAALLALTLVAVASRHRLAAPLQPPGVLHGAHVRVLDLLHRSAEAGTASPHGPQVWLQTTRGPIRLAGVAWPDDPASTPDASTLALSLPMNAELRCTPGVGNAYRVVLEGPRGHPRTDLALWQLAAGRLVPAGPPHVWASRYAAAAARPSPARPR